MYLILSNARVHITSDEFVLLRNAMELLCLQILPYSAARLQTKVFESVLPLL